MPIMDVLEANPFAVDETIPAHQFLQKHREEYVAFLIANPPQFRSKTWAKGNIRLTIRFKEGTPSKESKQDLKNKGMPSNLEGKTFVYIEIKDVKQHLSVHTRLESYALNVVCSVIQQKEQSQKFLQAGQLNSMDIIAFNYHQLLGAPHEFLSKFRCVSPPGYPTLVYQPLDRFAAQDISVPLSALTIPPVPPETVDETFSYTYDPVDVEQGTKCDGAMISISYTQLTRDNLPNQKPWRITISNYIISKRKHTTEKDKLNEKFFDLSWQDFQEMVQFVELETIRHLMYNIDLARWKEDLTMTDFQTAPN